MLAYGVDVCDGDVNMDGWRVGVKPGESRSQNQSQRLGVQFFWVKGEGEGCAANEEQRQHNCKGRDNDAEDADWVAVGVSVRAPLFLLVGLDARFLAPFSPLRLQVPFVFELFVPARIGISHLIDLILIYRIISIAFHSNLRSMLCCPVGSSVSLQSPIYRLRFTGYGFGFWSLPQFLASAIPRTHWRAAFLSFFLTRTHVAYNLNFNPNPPRADEYYYN